MSTGNVTVNGTVFNSTTTGAPFNFTGANNTQFSFRNQTAIADGYVALLINYTDAAGHTGNVTVYFYVDNTAPSSVAGLTNSSTGTYKPSAVQAIQVQIADVQQTNKTVTLNYYINGSWFTTFMTGTPSTLTVYSGTISTISNTTLLDAVTGKGYIPYYITGTDNATNTITNGGGVNSPLANLTIGTNATGTIQGYVFLTNRTIVPNSTSSLTVSDGTRSASVNTAGFYQITSVPAGTYTVTVSGSGYWTNSTSATVTADATTQANISVTGSENFNITLPGTSGTSISGFWNAGWNDFYFATRLYSAGTTNYTVAYLFQRMGVTGSYNYTAIWRYNATSQSWSSYIPDNSGTGDTLSNVTSSDDHYWVYVNSTDRVELESRYV